MSKVTNQTTQSIQNNRGNPPPQFQEGDSSHTVVSGNTLTGIAAEYGKTAQELGVENPQIENIHLIFPGDELRIPGSWIESTAPEQEATQTLSSHLSGDNFCGTGTEVAQTLISGGESIPFPTQTAAPTTTTRVHDLERQQEMAIQQGPVSQTGRVDGEETSMVDDRLNYGSTLILEAYARSAAAQIDEAVIAAGGQASRLGRAARVLGPLITAATIGYNQVENANTEHLALTTLQTGAATGFATAASMEHPGVFVVDAAISMLNDMTGWNVPTASGTFTESINQIATTFEGTYTAFQTGDTRQLENLHDENIRGENGVIFQAAAYAGEEVAESVDFWMTNDLGDVGAELVDGFGYLAGEAYDSIAFWD